MTAQPSFVGRSPAFWDHFFPKALGSYKDWRIGLPPQWYPTHSNAYYVGVTGGGFTEVSCMAMPPADTTV